MPSRRHHHRRSHWAPEVLAESARTQVAALFHRRFEFERPAEGWRLPEAPEMFPEQEWHVVELQAMKKELNAVKTQLSDKDIIAWHEHTCATNRAGLVVASVKRQIRPEMGTQAWCKFYELLSLCAVLPPGCEKGAVPLRSLHLCEAPGAFVTALNHYCVLNGVQEWEWRATTLNPYYEGNPLSRMISDDRFILPTLERWEFGDDDTGDLMTQANVDRLMGAAGSGINLVTADGSIDCQGSPAEQEGVVSDLHMCEVFCGLRALQPGGTLVVKMFTFFESSSVCLMYVLNCCFLQVTVVKPSCSKAGNSEVYVVCRGRLPDEPPAALMTGWWQRYGPQDRRHPLLARKHIPDAFIKQLVRCAGLFKSLQEAEISRNLRLFEAPARDDPAVWQELEVIRRAAVAEFIQRCRLTPIDKHLRLTHPLNTRLYTVFQVENKSGSGTYEQRTSSRSPLARLQGIGEQLASMPVPELMSDEVLWQPVVPTADPAESSSRTTGRLPSRLLASKFCCLHQVRLLVGAVEAVTELRADLLLEDVTPHASRTDGSVTVTVTLPWRAEPWPCDAAALTALRDGAALLQPGETLRVTGLHLLHRLNISLLQVMAARAGPDAEVYLLSPPADDTPPRPRVELRAVSEPAALLALLEWAIPVVAAGDCLSLLPLAEICQRPAAEQLVAYNDRLLRAITGHLVRSAGAEAAPQP